MNTVVVVCSDKEGRIKTVEYNIHQMVSVSDPGLPIGCSAAIVISRGK
jgi:hypothetical protein